MTGSEPGRICKRLHNSRGIITASWSGFDFNDGGMRLLSLAPNGTTLRDRRGVIARKSKGQVIKEPLH